MTWGERLEKIKQMHEGLNISQSLKDKLRAYEIFANDVLKEFEENVLVPIKIIKEGRFLDRVKILLSDHIIKSRKELEERANEYLTDGTMDGIAVSNYIKEELLKEK